MEGIKEVWSLTLAFIETMALKCVIELKIPDIIHSHGSPMSLTQIVAKIGSESLDISYLSRVMRLLVHKSVFAATTTISNDQSSETLYDLTHCSRCLLHDSDTTMVPLVMMITHPQLMAPWNQLSASILEGENPIKKAYGSSLWEILPADPNLNNVFNIAQESVTKFVAKGMLESYNNGFLGIETLVDVGGGTGYLLSEIVKANGFLTRGINFDLQHVIEMAPLYHGITHVGGNMFESIPDADGIIMKSVLHNWDDENCKKILQNCRRALLKTNNRKRIVLVETVKDDNGLLDESIIKKDILMMVHCTGGKERTRVEWTLLLEEGGFSQINFIKIPLNRYIIEAMQLN